MDENTIGVGCVLGTTYTGAFEDVAKLDKLLGAHRSGTDSCHHRAIPFC